MAFLIGTIEIFGLLSAELHIHGGFWDFMANFNINKAGFAIAGLFVAVWAVALGYWRFGRVEARWTADMDEVRRPPGAAARGGHRAVRVTWLPGPFGLPPQRVGFPPRNGGFSALPAAMRLGTLPGSGSAPPARFRASDGPRRRWRRGQGSTTRGHVVVAPSTVAGLSGHAIHPWRADAGRPAGKK